MKSTTTHDPSTSGPTLGGTTSGSDYTRATTGTASSEPRSLAELLREIANDLSRLFRSEIALARAEATDSVKKMAGSIVMMAIGGVLALAALIYVLQAVVYLLAEVMDPWLAALLVGVVVGIAGFAMIKVGQNCMAEASLTPERTVENVRKDINLVKEQVS